MHINTHRALADTDGANENEQTKTLQNRLNNRPISSNLTVFHSKHLFLSIEKAERLNARLILLFAVQIDFYAEIFVRKEQYEL